MEWGKGLHVKSKSDSIKQDVLAQKGLLQFQI